MKIRSDFVTNSSSANYILQLQIPAHKFTEREIMEEIIEAMHNVSWVLPMRDSSLKDTMTNKHSFSYEVERKRVKERVEKYINKIEIDGSRIYIHGNTSMYNDDFESIDPVINQIIHAVLTQQLFPTGKIIELVINSD